MKYENLEAAKKLCGEIDDLKSILKSLDTNGFITVKLNAKLGYEIFSMSVDPQDQTCSNVDAIRSECEDFVSMICIAHSDKLKELIKELESL